YLSSPYWWLGLVLMSIGEYGNFLAYGFALASIISLLGVVALISNCVIALAMLKEPFRGRDLLGVVVSICGAGIVVWSAEKEEVKLGSHQILEAIMQTTFEVYFGITCSLIALLMYISPKCGRKYTFIDLGLVGLFGSYTTLSTKGISSILSSSFYQIFTFPIAYPLAIILGSAILYRL
ncbi:magnesium transporter, partial [Tuber indicum]